MHLYTCLENRNSYFFSRLTNEFGNDKLNSSKNNITYDFITRFRHTYKQYTLNIISIIQ